VDAAAGTTNDDDLTREIRLLQARALREQGLDESALGAYKDALRSKKRDPELLKEARYERSKLLLARGKTAQATKDLQTVYASPLPRRKENVTEVQQDVPPQGRLRRTYLFVQAVSHLAVRLAPRPIFNLGASAHSVANVLSCLLRWLLIGAAGELAARSLAVALNCPSR
jgi:CHASE2 domain-containing sensor protein